MNPAQPDALDATRLAMWADSLEDWLQYARPIAADPKDPRHASLPDDARDNHAHYLRLLERALATSLPAECSNLLTHIRVGTQELRTMFTGPAAYVPAADQYPVEFLDRSVSAAADVLDFARSYRDAGRPYPDFGPSLKEAADLLADLISSALDSPDPDGSKAPILARAHEVRDGLRELL